MSQKNIEQFYQEILQDPALQEQFQSAPDQNSLVNLAVTLGKQKGYNFTAQDVEEWIAVNQNNQASDGELKDEELEAVAGGKIKPGNVIRTVVKTVNAGSQISGYCK